MISDQSTAVQLYTDLNWRISGLVLEAFPVQELCPRSELRIQLVPGGAPYRTDPVCGGPQDLQARVCVVVVFLGWVSLWLNSGSGFSLWFQSSDWILLDDGRTDGDQQTVDVSAGITWWYLLGASCWRSSVSRDPEADLEPAGGILYPLCSGIKSGFPSWTCCGRVNQDV